MRDGLHISMSKARDADRLQAVEGEPKSLDETIGLGIDRAFASLGGEKDKEPKERPRVEKGTPLISIPLDHCSENRQESEEERLTTCMSCKI